MHNVSPMYPLMPAPPVYKPVEPAYLNAAFCHKPLVVNARYAYLMLLLYSVDAEMEYVPLPCVASDKVVR